MKIKIHRKILIFCIILSIISISFFLIKRIVDLPYIVKIISKVGIIIGVGGGFFITVSVRLFGKDRTDAFLVNFSIFLTTLFILLILGEFFIRIIFKDITTTGDNNSYFARKWNKANIQLNTLRFREREFLLDKPDGVYRIAVTGDSFTFGQGIPENHRYTNLLEKKLNDIKIDTYEVLNFGVSGAQTYDEIAFLENVIIGVKPDYVILQWYVNDFEGHNKNLGDTLPLLPFHTLNKRLYRSSALYYLLDEQWGRLQKKFSSEESYEEYMYKRFGDPKSSDSIEHIQDLRHFIDICKNNKLPLGIVLFPTMLPNLNKNYPFDYLHKRVIELCNREGITCIDIRDAFAPYADEIGYMKLRLNKFDGHPSAFTNILVADRILDVFGSIWLGDVKSKSRRGIHDRRILELCQKLALSLPRSAAQTSPSFLGGDLLSVQP